MPTDRHSSAIETVLNLSLRLEKFTSHTGSCDYRGHANLLNF